MDPIRVEIVAVLLCFQLTLLDPVECGDQGVVRGPEFNSRL